MDATYLLKLLKEIQDVMMQNRDYLIDLDRVVGDGDLGLTMSDGFSAAYRAAKESGETDAGRLLYTAGKAMSTAVPSTMGTLMASGWMSAGKALRGKTELSEADAALLFSAYLDGVAKLGKAKAGEKTFLDGLSPAVDAMAAAAKAGEPLPEMAKKAAAAAKAGFESTAGMMAVHGRAATRGEASRPLKDPGAAVAALMMRAFEKSAS